MAGADADLPIWGSTASSGPTHAELRLAQRGLTTLEVEDAVREGHEVRDLNRGDADWRVESVRPDGRRFAVIYDCPVKGDAGLARVVSVWPLRGGR